MIFYLGYLHSFLIIILNIIHITSFLPLPLQLPVHHEPLLHTAMSAFHSEIFIVLPYSIRHASTAKRFRRSLTCGIRFGFSFHCLMVSGMLLLEAPSIVIDHFFIDFFKFLSRPVNTALYHFHLKLHDPCNLLVGQLLKIPE